jgi:hypothetical protein
MHASLSSSPSLRCVRAHPTRRMSVILDTFLMNVSRKPKYVSNRLKCYQALCLETCTCFVFTSEINSPRKHCCWTLRIFMTLTVTWSWEIHKEDFVIFPSVQFLSAFAKLRKVTISFVMSVRPHGRIRLPVDGLPLHLIFEHYSKICWEN